MLPRLLLALIVALVGSRPAHAQDVLLLPTGPVASDGQTPVTIQIYSPTLTPDTRIKLKVEGGKTSGPPQIAADGVATLSFVPPAVDAATDVPVSLKLRGPLMRADVTVDVPMVPAYGGTVGLSFDPAVWTPGTAGVMVRVQAIASPQSADTRQFLLRASAGTVDSAIHSGSGVYASRWVPPDSLDNTQVVLFTVADAAAPDRVLGWGTLPLLVRRSVTFDVPAGSNNLLSIADRTWGPFPASPAGTVAFDVEVPPGVTTGMLQTIAPGGAQSNNTVELPMAAEAIMAFVPLPPAVPADPKVPVQVNLVAIRGDGRPVEGAAPTVSASVGQLSALAPSAVPSVYSATWTPPSEPGLLELKAELGEARATADVRIVSPVPVVSLVTDPDTLPGKKRDTDLRATVKDSGGRALTDRLPILSFDGGAIYGRMVNNKDGTYGAKGRMGYKDVRMLVAVDPPVDPSGLPISRLLVWPAEGSAIADGTTEIPVTVAAVDAYGLPVAGVDVTLAVPRGEGSLPPTVTTGDHGIARAWFRAGSTPGPVTIRAEGGGLWTEALVFLHEAGFGAPVTAPTGTSRDQQVLDAWKKAAPTAIVWKESAKPAPPVVAAAPAAAPATVQPGTTQPVAPQPAAVQPGATPAATTQPTAAAPATAATPRQPRQRTPGEGAWMRLGGLVGTVAHVYQSQTEAAEEVPEDSSFTNGDLLGGSPFGALGVGFRGIVFPMGAPIGADIDARAYFDRVEAAGAEFNATNWALMAGARYRGSLARGLHWFVVGQAHRQAAMLFIYANDARTEVELLQHALWGGRAGGGLSFETGPLYLEAMVAETFVPYPIDTHAALGVEYEFQDNIAAHLGLDLDFRSIAFTVNEEDVTVKDQEHALRIGITRTFK